MTPFFKLVDASEEKEASTLTELIKYSKGFVLFFVFSQRWVRATRHRKLYLDDRRKVVTAQRAARRWLARRHQAASVIQQAVRNFLLLRRQRKFEQGVIKVQVWIPAAVPELVYAQTLL